MSKELHEYVAKCDICLVHRTAQQKEPLMQHEVVAQPWSKIGADLCELNNRMILVICIYYSNYIEIAKLSSVTSCSIIKEIKAVFARYGIPDIVVTDNGLQFASAESSAFAKTWMFTHNTSAPYHPQSNGKAENAVKTVKNIFTKCLESGQSEFLALLDWCNTPTEGIGTSPALRLMGHRCKTLIPVAGTLLKPSYPTEEDTWAIIGKRQKQQYYYNRHVKPLQPIASGETVRIIPPGEKYWVAGSCMGQVSPCSYHVEIDDSVYRHNRRDLITARQPPIVDIPENTDSQSAQSAAPQPEMPMIPTHPSPVPSPPPFGEQNLCRSQRNQKIPAALKDFVAK